MEREAKEREEEMEKEAEEAARKEARRERERARQAHLRAREEEKRGRPVVPIKIIIAQDVANNKVVCYYNPRFCPFLDP